MAFLFEALQHKRGVARTATAIEDESSAVIDRRYSGKRGRVFVSTRAARSNSRNALTLEVTQMRKPTFIALALV
jgi:hypothetical protein